MSTFTLLAGCLALGILVNLVRPVPQRVIHGLNAWILRVALPALALTALPRLEFTRDLWFLIAAMWLVFLGGWAVMAAAGARLGWSRVRTGAMALVAGFGNTAFVGYPMIEALRGAAVMPLAVVADQFGCFIALATGGVIVASWYGGDRTHPLALARRIVLFPPFIAAVASFAVEPLGGWPAAIDHALQLIGATLSPLALLSIGLQLSWRVSPGELRAAGVALGWKLLAAPALVGLLGLALGVRGPIFAVGVLQAAMGPMVSAAILAEEHNLDAAVANTTLAIGLLVSLVTVPVIDFALGPTP